MFAIRYTCKKIIPVIKNVVRNETVIVPKIQNPSIKQK